MMHYERTKSSSRDRGEIDRITRENPTEGEKGGREEGITDRSALRDASSQTARWFKAEYRLIVNCLIRF